METGIIDLHVHSSCSDGTLTPRELVAYALEKKLRAFALTDHDTICGLSQAFEAAQHTSLEIVAGIEFSTVYQGRDIHILGLDIDYENPDFTNPLCRFQHSRDIRNEKMIARLREGGVDISWEQMEAAFGQAVWTRAHFARYLMEHGYVKSLGEAFDRYVGDRCPYFVPREKVTPHQAVELIYQTGGIPVLAHPVLYHMRSEDLGSLVSSLKKSGLLAIEGIYSTHTLRDERLMRQLARSYGLALSGGTDFHGANKPKLDLGVGYKNLNIPYEILKNLRDRRKHS